jgi:polysaccharide export outer membrane protein
MDELKIKTEIKKYGAARSIIKPVRYLMTAVLPAAALFILSVVISGAVSADGAAAKEELCVESVKRFAEAACSGEYIIGAGDLVKVFVYENPEYGDNYRIGPDGKMSMPIIGTIEAAGLDRDGLAALIKKRLSRYIANPIVSVIVSEYNNNFVYLLGEIANPGRHDFKTEMNFISILPQAGLGNSLSGRNLKCDIIRRGGVIFTIDLSNYDAVLQNRILLNLKLSNNDILYFGRSDNLKDSVYVLGAVKNPGIFKLDKKDGLKKLLDDKVELNPKISKILKVIRKMPERTLQFEYNLNRAASANPAIEDGDMIYVQQNYDKNLAYCIKEISPYVVISLIGNEAVKMARDK